MVPRSTSRSTARSACAPPNLLLICRSETWVVKPAPSGVELALQVRVLVLVLLVEDQGVAGFLVRIHERRDLLTVDRLDGELDRNSSFRLCEREDRAVPLAAANVLNATVATALRGEQDVLADGLASGLDRLLGAVGHVVRLREEHVDL